MAQHKQRFSPLRDRLVVLAQAVGTVAAVVLLSLLVRTLWHAPAEELPDFSALTVTAEMTLGQLAEQNNLPPKVVAKALKAELPAQAGQTIAALGLSAEQARQALARTLALKAERESKDFGKIYVKFALWIVLLILPLVLLIRRRLTRAAQVAMLAGAAVLFGVILGSDPSPMGTVKDAIVLGGAHRAVFWPRIIALAVFLLIVVAANKFICSWGCQFGTLQELLYRLNRRGPARRGVFPLIRLPYTLSATIRVLVFIALIVVAFAWAFDLIGPVDPFKVYRPAALGWLGGGFVALLLVASVVVYRPWCSLFCPFGLVAWLFERLSFWRVRVDLGKCIACQACALACPSESMHGILLRRALPQDCFACGDCLKACPTGAVQFTRPGAIRRSAQDADVLAKLRR